MIMKTTSSNVPLIISDVIKDFLFHCKYEKGLDPKSVYAYETDLQQFAVYLKTSVAIEQIDLVSKDIIKRYLQSLSGFKPKTIKRKVASIKAMLNYFEYENEAYVNPFRKIKINLKEPFVLPVVMDVKEVSRIIRHLYCIRDRILDTGSYAYREAVRNIAVVELLFATGVRVSELCGLKNTDVNLCSNMIKVFGKGGKERIIQICSRDVITVLKQYQILFKPKSTFFINRLGNPLSTQSVRLMIKRCLSELDVTKRITPHTFRHTFATLLLEEDVDIKYIQSLLGHSSITTTQIYTHVNAAKQKRILSAKHPRRKIIIHNKNN